jgi:2-C-methyl-D-erythritol 4-phosphate cytidylyltransferase
VSLPRGGPAVLRAAVVILAAGEGSRVGHDTNKVLLQVAGRPVFTWSIRWARALAQVTHTVLVIREQDRGAVLTALRSEVDGPDVLLVTGGETRHDSEWASLKVLEPAIESDEIDVVVIHDAARPLAGTALFSRVIEACRTHAGAIPVVTQGSLTALASDEDPPQTPVVAVQTPQAFRSRPLLTAYTQAAAEGFLGTDTASCVERYTDLPVHWVVGDPRNVKITFPDDLLLVERLLVKAGGDLSHLGG